MAQMQWTDGCKDGRMDGVGGVQLASMKSPREVKDHDFKGRCVKVAHVFP